MKLYINQNNFYNLKPLIAISVTGLSVQVKEWTAQQDDEIHERPKNVHLPLLEVEPGNHLFSTNAMCRYLFSKAKQLDFDVETEQWLEWESSKLQPHVHAVIHHRMASSKIENSLANSLKSCLQHLDAHMEDAIFKTPGLASIVIWCTLYPLTMDADLKAEYLSQFNLLSKWHWGLSEMEAIRSVVHKSFGGKNLAACKEFQKYLHPLLPVSRSSSSTVSSNITQNSPHKDIPNPENLTPELPVSPEEISTAVDFWNQKELPPLKAKPVPVLPVKGERNVLITSALPYVNNVPHLGNIIGSVLSADVYARFCRARQYNTLYVCGTDEYGTATETKAMEEGLTVEEICSKFRKLHTDIYQWFEISFDYFGRTTTEKQTEIAQDLFWKLHKEDFLLENTVEQLFCCKCERFLADRFVEGTCPFCLYEDARGDQCDKCGKLINAPELKNARCKVCQQTPIIKSSKHLFLDLPKLMPHVKAWFEETTEKGHWSTTAKVITASWLKEGLKPRCITRDLKWGTPVPLEGFTDKVFYVWFDAPIGYLSISANYTDKWEEWWKQPDVVELYQFMAKDNVPFHSIIFPCTVLGSRDNYVKVGHLSAVEYLNYEDTKFSKSRGIGVFGNDAKDTGIPADTWRFYLLYIRPESQDTSFNWSDLMTKANSELLNNLGNFINRALMFISNNFNGVIPDLVLSDDDKILLALINRELKQYVDLMERLRLRDALKHILNISRLGNQHIQSNKPWEKVKGTPEEKQRSGSIMGLCANIACLLATLLQPYMPATSDTLKQQLNSRPECHVITPHVMMFLPPGHKIGKPFPLFKKIEQSHIQELKKRYAGRQESPEKQTKKGNAKVPNKVLPNGDQIIKKSSDEDIQKIQQLVTEQGNKVRELKAAKANKADVDKEVAVLLDLKRQLAIASGQNPNEITAKGNKKKK